MKKILSILTVGCALTLSSCEDWLDKYPLAQMSPETFFSNENELQAFSNTFYTIFPGDGLYNEGYDNIVKNEIAAEMRDGRTIPASGGGWTWTDLRKFNTLLEYSGNCKDTDIRNRYDAVARFFRAYFYFEKVKRFGDVPWYAKPLGSADPELKRPRDSREFVMQRMIEDIDFAIRYLPAERDLYRVTKWTALALKSRFCLFEGTFRKYHSIDGYEHDWKWYLEQAADAAEEFITNSGYSLYTATGPATSYRDLFASENAQSVEVILARDYNSALGVFHNANFYTISASYESRSTFSSQLRAFTLYLKYFSQVDLKSCFLFCSHCLRLQRLMPSLSAYSLCVRPSFIRIALICLPWPFLRKRL